MRLITLLLTVLTTGLLLYTQPNTSQGASLATAPDVPWTQPTDLQTKKLNTPTPAEDREETCSYLTYRDIDDETKTMHSECFVPTAIGLYASNGARLIATGTDEALPLSQGSLGVLLKPIPYSGMFATFEDRPNLDRGSYMYFYTLLSKNLSLYRKSLSGDRALRVTGSPELALKQPNGQLLPVEPTAMNFAARGQWMIVESPGIGIVRVNMATHDMLAFGRSFDDELRKGQGSGYSLVITEDGRYATVSSTRHQFFRVYDLKSCTPSPAAATNALEAQQCSVRDYWPAVQAAAGESITSIRRLRFIHDGLLKFVVTTASGKQVYLMSPDGPITTLIPYLGLGDSFASGEGAWNYQTGTDTATNRCHTSFHSYPLRMSAEVFSQNGKSVACSGARIHDIHNSSLRYAGQNSDQQSVAERQTNGTLAQILSDYTPGYLPQQSFVQTYQPGVATIQIGGNDIGFAKILLTCVSPLASIKPLITNPNDCYSTRQDRLELMQTIDRNYRRWVQLFSELRATSPLSGMYAVGYPHIVSPNGKCGLNAPLSMGDIALARSITDYLNDTIAKAARTAGVTFIDISTALAGHELCSGARRIAVNGITAGTDTLHILGRESFHPNALGHELITAAILRQTNRFRAARQEVPDPTSTAPNIPDTHPLLQAPASSREVRRIIPAAFVSPAIVTRTKSVHITLDAAQVGWVPGAQLVVKLGDTVIGSLPMQPDGTVTGTVPIPDSANPGVQPITVTGPGQSSDPITTEDTVYVPVDPNDSDGDGITNDNDTCPLIPSTYIDADNDGVDDACDGVIETPTPPNNSQPAHETYSDGPGASQPSTQEPLRVTMSASKLQGILLTPKLSATLGQSPMRSPPATADLRTSTSTIQKSENINPGSQQSTAPTTMPSFAWYVWAVLGVIALTILYWASTYKSEY